MRHFFVLVITLLFSFSVYSNNSNVSLLPAESVKVRSSTREDQAHSEQYAPILLVSCVDYTFPDEIVDFMDKRGAADAYDHLVVTGGSIGIDNLLYPVLKESFIIQMALLKKLHNFQHVILLDHRDCALFKEIHGPDHSNDPQEEFKLHQYHLNKVKKLILSEYPDVSVELLLMSTDGSVVTIK